MSKASNRDSDRIVEVPKPIHQLAQQVGEFIQYWGFKEIHGQIWAHVWLAKTPIDATTLVKRLGVSKALVSLAIKDLVHFEVIQILSEGDRRKMLLVANTDVYTVITNVLKQRETRMLDSILKTQTDVLGLSETEKKKFDLDSTRIEMMIQMTEMAKIALKALVETNLEIVQSMKMSK